MLFDYNSEKEVLGLKLHRVNEKSEQVFLDYLMNSDYSRVSFYSSFYYLYPINMSSENQVEFYYITINDWLCVFEYNKASKTYAIKTAPINKYGDYTNLKQMYKIFIGITSKLNDNLNKVTKIYNIFEKDCNDIFNIKNLTNEKNYKEFIFRCEDLINLQGKEYKSRRYMVNKLRSEHDTLNFRPYTLDDKKSVLDVYMNWVKDYGVRLEGEEVVNKGLVEYTLQKYENSVNYKIFVGTIDNKVEGFIVIVPLCKDTKCVLIEYTNIEIKGLAEYLWYEGLRHTTELGTYENDGTGGKETDGLFFYKNSHRPIGFVETRAVNLSKRGKKVNKSIFRKEE